MREKGTDRAAFLRGEVEAYTWRRPAFHYVPLHGSAAGRKFGRVAGPMTVTDDVSRRLLRLPLWPDMPGAQVDEVIAPPRDSARR